VTATAAFRAPARRLRQFRLVAFGTYTRTLVMAHGRHAGTVIAALLIVALTLDIAPRSERIAAQSADQSALGLTLHMLWYLALRVADLLGNLLPLACFMGLFWSEITLTQSRERIVVWNGGRTPMQSLIPIVVLGVIFGAVQVIALSVLRPAAVAHQIETGLGEYGARFDRRLKPNDWRWIAVPNHLFQARIDYRRNTLVDVQVFMLSDEGRLVGRLEAASATPTGEPGRWLFRDGSRWTAPPDGEGTQATGTGEAHRFTAETIALPLNPLWLSNFGIDARYLPQATLSALAGSSDIADRASYTSWWHVRIGQAILPFGMMLLASALSVTLIGQRTSFTPMILIGLAGYFLYVTTNIVVWFGEYGQVPGLVAAWLMPLAMIAAGLALMARIERRGRG
jgi:lipopolysaccharide export system permease protein